MAGSAHLQLKNGANKLFPRHEQSLGQMSWDKKELETYTIKASDEEDSVCLLSLSSFLEEMVVGDELRLEPTLITFLSLFKRLESYD
ncbi:hypothetical protein BpHYR1_018871 [Brachionus plicatilis]|uniref:Uncharacterized protein n=1 Tax=Brachionus plicatilis TaxID=10195 RepID=A0A3M7P3B0_BRAPC|nr:hypothetical protein BpHYR1_018871 [Brachionus plicatilis]